MANSISINLLPKDILTARRRSFKLALAYKISIIILIVIAVITSTILSVRFGQGVRLRQTQEQITKLETQIGALKAREEQAVVIKQKLATINKLSGADKAKKELFEKMVSIVPPGIKLKETLIDPSGNMEVSANTTSLAAIDALIKAIDGQRKDTPLMKRVELESLSLNKNGFYTLLFKVLPSGG